MERASLKTMAAHFGGRGGMVVLGEWHSQGRAILGEAGPIQTGLVG